MKYLTTYILIFFLLHNCYSQTPSYKNLIFEGAGIRGIAYSGVIKELENKNMIDSVVKVGGTSSGAITALMLSIHYTAAEITEIISTSKMKDFKDGQFIFFGGISRMKKKYGWYKNDAFTKWVEKIIEDKTGNSEITFSELNEKGYKDLYITATCLNKQNLVVFSKETYPAMKIKEAVKISMSIPLFFEAVYIDSLGQVFEKQNPSNTLDIVVDGGIIGNYPIFIFDSIYVDSLGKKRRIPNYNTLGVRIDSDRQIESDSLGKELVSIPIHSMADYITAFYVLVQENLNRSQLIPEDWERTISVSSVGIGPKIKKLSKVQIQELIDSGARSTHKFINTQH